MSEKGITELFGLLDAYRVEIPRVQRDYAQGRRDRHATTVRTNLLKDMKAAILGGTPLDLSFIYGKAEAGKFIPVDGQQRLTTLFLLFLYVFREDETKTGILRNFTYETRITSREFLKKLIKNRRAALGSEKCPSAEIEDSEWFMPRWMHDPTVQSMLVMLDEIKRVFEDVEDLAERLSGRAEAPVTFQFLDMDDLGMEDGLYIKLNARGKALTDFENFKAQMIARMKQLGLPEAGKFERKLDGEWTDLFWGYYKEGSFDKMYGSFFYVLLMNHMAGIGDGENKTDYGQLDEETWVHTLDYSSLNEEFFDTVFYTLEFLCQNPGREEVNALIFSALPEGRTYTRRILFHAVTAYLSGAEGEDKGSMGGWLRIFKNLALNSGLDNLTRYHNAIKGMNALSGNWDDLVSYFADGNRVAGFNQLQIEEEQQKARIILMDPSFAEKIYKAEQHPYFSGQIRAALSLSRNGDGIYEEERFEHIWEKIAALFDQSKPRYGNLLRRALLTFGDYTLPVSQFKTLCVDDPNETARTPSLKALFSSCGDAAVRLLDTLDVGAGVDVKTQLEQLLALSEVKGDDWRYCFIHYPELFEWMSASHLRLRSLNGKIHMIQNKWANGYNYDLFLSALCAELRRRGIEPEFDGELGTAVEHCLYVEEYTVSYQEKKYTVRNRKNKKVFLSGAENPISETADFLARHTQRLGRGK